MKLKTDFLRNQKVFQIQVSNLKKKTFFFVTDKITCTICLWRAFLCSLKFLGCVRNILKMLVLHSVRLQPPRLSWKLLPGTNSVVYFASRSPTKKESFLNIGIKIGRAIVFISHNICIQILVDFIDLKNKN